MNVTLSIDDELVKKVRKVAVERDTTLTGMVRSYLETRIDGRHLVREVTLGDGTVIPAGAVRPAGQPCAVPDRPVALGTGTGAGHGRPVQPPPLRGPCLDVREPPQPARP